MGISRIITLTVLIAALVLGDQISKILLLNMYQANELPIYVTGFFNLVLALNRGVSFSFLESNSAHMPYILAGVSIFVSLALFIWMARETKLMIQLGLGFIISGAIGNAIDRFTHLAVVDFLQFHYNDWYFPAFNVADICINIGVGLVLLDVLFMAGHRTDGK